MKNRLSTYLLIQLIALIIAGSMSGFLAIISTGAIGGTAMGVAPEFTFGLVEGIVCPEGTTLVFSSVRRSYHSPGESEPQVECVGVDGSEENILVEAILTILGLTFLVVFIATIIPLTIILTIIGLLVVRRIGSGRD